jgi:hypothetical protein
MTDLRFALVTCRPNNRESNTASKKEVVALLPPLRFKM